MILLLRLVEVLLDLSAAFNTIDQDNLFVFLRNMSEFVEML